jgi:RecA-family ATPase
MAYGPDDYGDPGRVVELPASRLRPFESRSVARWQGIKAPAREWFVEDCFPAGNVGLISGDGGLGKSLLMQQLCTCAAVGRPWLGLNVTRSNSLAFFCEDDEAELHRRQEAICESLDVEMADAGDFEFVSRAGEENVLVEFDRRTDKAQPTTLWTQLQERVLDLGSQLVVLDTVADVFGGNEITRNQVRRFVSLLRGLAVRIHGAVILTSHPSIIGMSSGSGISGSTAWNNSVRGRLYLTSDKAASDDDGSGDRDVRYLKTMKSNYGAVGSKLRLRWDRGVFVRDDMAAGDYGSPGPAPVEPAGVIERLSADQDILAAMSELVRRGARFSPLTKARNNIVTIIKGEGMCSSVPDGYLRRFKDQAVKDGRLERVSLVSKNRKAVELIRPRDVTYPEEAQTVIRLNSD